MSLLELRGIAKRYGATQALADASFSLSAGEVHALCGANGAGKSTLSRVISGHVQPDEGGIILDGKPLRLTSSRDALRNGICMVTQETTLAPDLSVLENIMLPRLGLPGRLNWRALRREAETLLRSLGEDVQLSLDAPAGSLSIGQRQMVEILKALALDSRIIIFDEPTASLSPFESEILFGIMRDLTGRGHALVFVSHRIEEIFGVCDRITVLREGQVVAAGVQTSSLTSGDLVRLMIGRDLKDVFARPDTAIPDPGTHDAALVARPEAEIMLQVRNLSSHPAVRDVSFEVRAGEIVGLAGLIGAGRSEALETIFGLRERTGGSVRLRGRDFHARRPVDAIRAGIGLVPEDRRHQSIIPDFSVRENLFLAHLGKKRGTGRGYDNLRPEVERLLDLLGMSRDRLFDADLLGFSGGMQQKIILARWLLLRPQILMLDEPTRGVDIGTRAGIYALLRQIAAEGVAVVVVSSDFEEVIGLADRIVVMSDGISVADLPSRLLSIESLAMFASPRSSAQRTHAALEALARDHGGVAFWIGIEENSLFCFDRTGTDMAAEPGFAPGTIHDVSDVAIPVALGARAPDFVMEADGRSTLLVPISGRHGHELGVIGLTLRAGATKPEPDAIIGAVTARLSIRKPGSVAEAA